MRILLVPPATRPPTLDLPVQLGRMTGAEMLVPPAPALPFFFTPGNTDLLKSWLLENAAGTDALVVCLETLTLGGMIPARRVSDSLEVALSRLETMVLMAGFDLPMRAIREVRTCSARCHHRSRSSPRRLRSRAAH